MARRPPPRRHPEIGLLLAGPLLEGLGEKELVIVLCPFGVSLVGRTEAVPDFQGTETSVLGLSKTKG